MAMVIGSWGSMFCEECGGYCFAAYMKNGKMTVHHVSATEAREFSSVMADIFERCPNAGKDFVFPEAVPLVGVEKVA